MHKISSPLKFRDLKDLDLWQSPWEHCALWCPPGSKGIVVDGWNSWKERDGVHEDHRENHFLLMSFFAWRWRMWNDFLLGSCGTFLFEWLGENQSSLEDTLRNLSVFWLQSVVSTKNGWQIEMDSQPWISLGSLNHPTHQGFFRHWLCDICVSTEHWYGRVTPIFPAVVKEWEFHDETFPGPSYF